MKHAVVEASRTLTPRVVELTLRPDDPEGERFRPGQHLWIEGGAESRPFSIASPPGDRRALRLCVKRAGAGSVSDRLASLRVGDRVSYTGPSGGFVLRDDPGRRLLFIAGGIGLAPLRSMILHRLAEPPPVEIDLLHGVRGQEDLLYPDEFAALSERHPDFSYHPCLSQGEDRWIGLRGRVTAVLAMLFPVLRDRSIYVCGGGELIRDTLALLDSLGGDPDRIYTEMGTAREIAVRQASH